MQPRWQRYRGDLRTARGGAPGCRRVVARGARDAGAGGICAEAAGVAAGAAARPDAIADAGAGGAVSFAAGVVGVVSFTAALADAVVAAACLAGSTFAALVVLATAGALAGAVVFTTVSFDGPQTLFCIS